MARRFKRSCCRSRRCITSRSTTRRRTGSTAIGRTTARCADRARRRKAATATRGIAAGTGRGRGGGGGGERDARFDGGRGGRGRARQRRGRGGRLRRGRGGRGARADSAGADSTGGGGGGGGGRRDVRRGITGSAAANPASRCPISPIRTSSGRAATETRSRATTTRTKRARSVSPWIHTLDSPPNKLKYRCHWTPPLAIDPFDHNTVYYGCQVDIQDL